MKLLLICNEYFKVCSWHRMLRPLLVEHQMNTHKNTHILPSWMSYGQSLFYKQSQSGFTDITYSALPALSGWFTLRYTQQVRHSFPMRPRYKLRVSVVIDTICHSWMETFSALLAHYVGKSPVNGEFPSQRSVAWRFDVFFDLRLNKRLSKQSWVPWFEMPLGSLWHHCTVLCVMPWKYLVNMLYIADPTSSLLTVYLSP